MKTASKWITILVAIVGLGIWAIPTSRGDEAATTQPSDKPMGSITGTVMKDGKPLANARVGLIDIADMKSKLGKRGKQDPANTEKRQRPTPTAMTETDSEGKFALNDVKAGEYMVMAMVKGEGRGRARASVKPGATESIEIQIMARDATGATAHAAKASKAGKAAKASKANTADNAN